MEEQKETVEKIKDKALELWHELNESEMDYEDFVDTVDFIIKLFSDIN